MTPKPQALRPRFEAIPHALRALPAWVAWRYEHRGERWTKPPRRADGDGYARTDDPTTWADFETARKAAEGGADGFGIVLTDDLAGVDLDHVLGDDGVIEPWAAEVIERFGGCYVERSPGGDGLRVFCRGEVQHSGKAGPGNRLEIYGRGSPRYLTVTGHKYGDGDVIGAQAALDWLHACHFEAREVKPATTPKADATNVLMNDDDVIARARCAKNGQKFLRLFGGQGEGDASADDAALLGILAFWTQDRAQLDRLFRRSGLMRVKWDEKRGARTYGERTIDAVLNMGGETCSPQRITTQVEPSPAWGSVNPLPEPKSEEPAAFPFDGLGPLMGAAARTLAEVVQAPDALAAGSVLAAAALAAQPHADVRMPHGDTSPLSLFIVTSATSGDRKSATDKVACEPIEKRRRDDANDHTQAHAQWRDDQRGRKRGEPTDPPPPARALVVSKGTTEGLHHLLRGQSHVGLFSPEGAELVGGHSLREERRSAGIAWLLKAWGGETLDSLTKTDGLSVLFGRRVTMHTLLQPVILQTMMADPLAQGQGWIARCLIAQPRTLAGTRLFREGPPAREHAAVQAFHAALERLLEREPETDDDGLALQPRVLTMTDEARALWSAFYDAVEVEQAEDGALVSARPWTSKAAEHAARVAAVVTMIGDLQASEVTGRTMRGALAVTDFYLREHVRLSGQSRERQHLQRLHALLTWLRERGATVKHADVLQFTPRPLRDLKAGGLGRLLSELAQRGYVRRVGDRWEVRPDA